MDAGESRTTACSRGVRQGDHQGGRPQYGAGNALLSSLRRGLKRFRVELVRERAEAFAYMNEWRHPRPHGGHSEHGQRALPFLESGLDGIGIVVNSTKAVVPALPATGHVSTTEEGLLLLGVWKPNSRTGRVTVGGGVPIGTQAYIVERAVGIGRDRCADFLARLPGKHVPGKQATAHIVTESIGPRTGYLERVIRTGRSLQACTRGDKGA